MQFNWPEFAASIITAAKLNVLYIIRPLSVETVDYAFQAEFVLKPVAMYTREQLHSCLSTRCVSTACFQLL